MSITVNGATNTITAASGLAIAGNTAVTGALSATGVTSLAAGAVGAPGLYLGADTTTGLYRIGANNYGVAVSGAKVLDIASTGLAVTGAVTSDSFKKGDTGNFVVGGGAGGATYLDSGAATDINIRPGGSSIAGTFSSTGLAVTGTLSAANGANPGVLQLGSSTAGADIYAYTQYLSGTAIKAWQVGNLSGTFTWTPSTANGGTTFTTPAMSLTPTGLTLGSGVGLTSPGQIQGTLNSADQVTAVGWESGIGGTTNAGSIRVGGNASYYGRFSFSPAGNGSVFLDNAYDDAGAEVVIRTRTLGTPVQVAKFQSTAVTLGTGVNLVMASGQGIGFSATANGSGTTTSEVLSDYEEGTWTPSLSFATPGDLSVAYSARTGQYQKVGNKVTVWFQITTSTFTHTTASSYLFMSGLPFNVGSVTQMDAGVGWWTGVTKASYTDLGLRAESTSATASFAMSGSGQAVSFVNAVDVPTGTTKQFEGQISYLV
jgi:hypothetical protein